jgi:hypothetical protein
MKMDEGGNSFEHFTVTEGGPTTHTRSVASVVDDDRCLSNSVIAANVSEGDATNGALPPLATA